MKRCPHCNATYPDSTARCPRDGLDLVDDEDPFSSASVRNVDAFTTSDSSGSTFSAPGLGAAGSSGNDDGSLDIGRLMVSDAAGKLTPDQAQTIFKALSSGNKIEAIRLFRTYTGAGLKDAKDAVEAAGSAGSDSSPVDAKRILSESGFGNLTSEQKVMVIQILRSGNKIAAIKALRDATGMGLKDSKNVVDSICQSEGLAPQASGGCAAVLVGGIGVGFATWFMHHFIR